MLFASCSPSPLLAVTACSGSLNNLRSFRCCPYGVDQDREMLTKLSGYGYDREDDLTATGGDMTVLRLELIVGPSNDKYT
jgi:hypothetical protein